MEVFAAIDRLEADVAVRLEALPRVLAAAAPFVSSVRAEQVRHRAERSRLRRRLRVPPRGEPVGAAAGPADADLRALRDAQQALVHAHAEGLPALGDAHAVDVLATHMVRLAAQLTVIDLWIEAEEARA